jgi:cyanate permease
MPNRTGTTFTRAPSWRRLLLLYSVAALLVGGFTLRGWLNDCAPHQVDGQCGMSTAFGAAIGLICAFPILAFGHWFPILSRLAGLSRRPNSQTTKRVLTNVAGGEADQPPTAAADRALLKRSSDQRSS